MKPSLCKFWFFHSFLHEHLDFDALLKAPEDVLAVPDEPSDPFSPYVSVYEDEIVRQPMAYPGGRINGIMLGNHRKTVDCTIDRKYHIEASGLCSHISELAVSKHEALRVADIIRIANAFEDELSFRREIEGHVSEVAASRFIADELCYMQRVIDPLATKRKKHNMFDSLSVKQLPYVATIIGFNNAKDYHEKVLRPLEELRAHAESGLARSHDMDCEDQVKAAKALAAILYRFKKPDSWSEVDLSYVRAFSARRGHGLANHHPHRGVYLTLHLRSMLVAADISEPQGNTVRLSEAYLPALRSTLADSWSKWYGLVVLNSQIDQYLQTLRRRIQPVAIVEQLLGFRKLAISLLDATVGQKHASGSLAELHREFSSLFSIGALRRDVVDKINILDQIYQNIQELRIIRDRSDK